MCSTTANYSAMDAALAEKDIIGDALGAVEYHFAALQSTIRKLLVRIQEVGKELGGVLSEQEFESKSKILADLQEAHTINELAAEKAMIEVSRLTANWQEALQRAKMISCS